MNTTTSTSINNFTYFNPLLFHESYVFITLTKLTLSIVLSFIISVEREMHSHPGGACTHMLVGLGSCLYTMISIHIHEANHSVEGDPSRICAQIVSGMGFLGSATIFKSQNYVKGINTAANLWISAAISMAIGANLWEFGLATSFFTIIILFINNRYKRYRYKKNNQSESISMNHNQVSNDIELGIQSISNRESLSLSRDACDAPYGDENDQKID